MEAPLNLENEKKKNIRLAIGMAALGVLGFIIFYIAYFVLFFCYPSKLFNLMPFPSFTESVVGLKGNLLIFSKAVSFKGPMLENPPEERMVYRVFDGKSLSKPEEAKPFTSLCPTEDKIYFFDQGLYRTFDGKNWESFKNPAIGSNPKGAISPSGIWVLSTHKKNPVLNLISGEEIREIPLPANELLEKIGVCSSQLLCLENELHLFFNEEDTLLWYKYDGEKWDQPESFENGGDYEAVALKDGIFLFQNISSFKQTEMTLRTYSKNAWSEPKTFPIRGTSFQSFVAIFKERPILFQQAFFSEKYYVVEGEQLLGPYRIPKAFFSSSFLRKGISFGLLSIIITFFLVFLISLLLRRYKLRIWKTDSTEYEFASLFRRFLAESIDSIITMIPVGIPLYFIYKEGSFFDNPFRFAAIAMFSTGCLLLLNFLYHSFLEGLWGKTIGKMICSIIVLKDDFTKCNIGRAFLRNLMRIVDIFFYYLVAVVLMAGTMKWQRLGDIVAETVVVTD